MIGYLPLSSLLHGFLEDTLVGGTSHPKPSKAPSILKRVHSVSSKNVQIVTAYLMIRL